LGQGYWVKGIGSCVLGQGYWVMAFGSRVVGQEVEGQGFWVKGCVSRVLGEGFWVKGLGPRRIWFVYSNYDIYAYISNCTILLIITNLMESKSLCFARVVCIVVEYRTL
jgi:hypothetical protein